MASAAADCADVTKLNRSQVVHGETAFILPCLGRTELDEQEAGRRPCRSRTAPPASMVRVAGVQPASANLRSEPAIIAGIAKATLAPNPHVDWDGWVADYDRVRDAIGATYPTIFRDMSRRMWEPGQLPSPLAGARRNMEHRARARRTSSRRKHWRRDIDTPVEQRDIVQFDHAAQQRSVQHHRVWLRRSFPWRARHPHGRADAPQRYSALRLERARRGDAEHGGRRRSPALRSLD